MKPAAKYALYFLLALLVVSFRVVQLDADPPAWLSWSSGIYSDEGIYASDARSVVLFGHWSRGDFHSAEIMPLQHLLLLAVFKIFGVSLIAARSVSVTASLLTVLLFFLALKNLYDERTGFIGAVYLGLSPVFLFYNRLALLETPTVLFLVAALYLMSVNRTGWPSGLMLALAICFKPLAIFCVPAFFCDFKNSREESFSRLIALGAGLLAYFLIWQSPHKSEITRLNHYYLVHQYLPHSFSQLRWNLVRSLWSGSSDGIVPYLVHHSGPLFVLLLVAAIGKAVRKDRTALVFVIWLAAPVIALCFLSYEPSRYFILFWPALAAIAAIVTSRLPEASCGAVTALVAIASIVNIVPVLARPTYIIRDAGITVAKQLPKNQEIIGQYAPEFALSNRLACVYVQPGLANSSGNIKHDVVLITESRYWTAYWNRRTQNKLAQLPGITFSLPHLQIVTLWQFPKSVSQ